MLCKYRNNNRFDRCITIALLAVLSLLVVTALLFMYEVRKEAKKEATLDTGKSELTTVDSDSSKPVVQHNGTVTNQVQADVENSKEQTPNTKMSEEFISDKLEADIKKIIQNEPGLYSIAYQNVVSTNKLTINSQKMTAASVIKLYVMIETYNQINEGRINENDKITLISSMKAGGTGSLAGRKDGTVLSIDQLINVMITQSDNTAANILIDRLTMEKINATAQKLGCLDTVIQRKMVDFKAQTEGKENYTSVTDLSCVLMKIYKNECLGEKYDQKMIEVLKKQENNSKIPYLLPAGTVVAHKTGELDKVENDAGIIFTDKSAYVLCILSNDVEASKARMIIGRVSKVVFDNTSFND